MRLWIVAIILLAPGAAAVPVDLYMHLADFQDLPINTQEPQGESWHRSGMAGHSHCIPPASPATAPQSRHTWYAFSSPGLVEYNMSDERPRSYIERGLGVDLRLDPALTPVLSWHLVAIGPAQGTEGLPAVVPEVIVRVQVRASNAISIDHKALDAAPLIASGEVGPVTLHERIDHPAVTHHAVGQLAVYAFHVPLELHNATILRDQGYNIRIDAMMENPHCTQSTRGGYIMPDLVTAYQGHGLWNRLHVGVENPLELRYLHMQYVGTDIVVHASGASPFGLFDVSSARLLLDGPTPLVGQALHSPAQVHAHGQGFSAFEQAWRVNVTGVQQGLYTVDVTFVNLQCSANVSARAVFEIGDHGVRICNSRGIGQECLTYRHDAPGLTALPLAWLLAGAVILRRPLRTSAGPRAPAAD